MSDGLIRVASGVLVNPFDPDPSDICIDDIATALANKARFSGHTRNIISVAQHSILVSRECDEEFAIYGLLHDAAEYLLPDLPSPCKNAFWIECDGIMEPFAFVEDRVLRKVFHALGIPFDQRKLNAIKETDRRVGSTEARDAQGYAWNGHEPYVWTVVPQPPSQARESFLQRYAELTRKEEFCIR